MDKFHLYLYLILSVVLLIIGFFPCYGGIYATMILTLSFIYLVGSELWSFLAGHLRVVPLGQQAFIGLGMYTLAILNEIFKWPLWASIILSGFVGAAGAALLSLSFLRLRGFYFSLATILFAEILFNFFRNWSFTGATTGMRLTISYTIPIDLIYYMAYLLSLVSIFAVIYIHKSKMGFAIRATGCDEEAASEIGINIFSCKAICFILSGFLTALAGSVFTLQTAYVHPQAAFSFDMGLSFVFISVIGGIGTIIGPIIGSTIYVVLRSLLSGIPGLSMLMQGILCAGILVAAPKGIWGHTSGYVRLLVGKIWKIFVSRSI